MATAAVRQGNAGEAGEPLAFCETTKPEKATQASETAQPQERSMWLTAAKLQRVALFLLEVVLAVAIGIFVTGWLAGTSLFSLPATLLLSGLAFFDICMLERIREKIYDFQDPAEVRALQAEASLLAFEELRQKHTWSEIAQLLVLPKIQEKCEKHVLVHFDWFRDHGFHLSEFVERGLITPEQRNWVLQGSYEDFQNSIG